MTYPSTSLLRRASATFAVGAALVFGSVASAATILVDFGWSSTSPTNYVTNLTGWNNITSGAQGTTLALVDSTGAATGVTLTITSQFNTGLNPNTAGTTASTLYPASATRDSQFANTATFNGQSNLTPVITFSGLDSNTTYAFTYYASRMGGTQNRSTDYSLTNGVLTDIKTLNATDNINGVVTSDFLAPSVSSTLTLSLSANTLNNTTEKFIYLGVLEITTQAIPEPGSYAAIAGLAALGFIGARRRARA